MSQKKLCRTLNLPDDPTSEDAFKTHRRVARALLDMVQHEEGGKIVALEGTWGSGKSSVIRMLQRMLKNEGNGARVAIFVFDAWAHQGETLRRAFLEHLDKFLRNCRWGNPEEWRQDIEAITGRTIERKIATKVSLSRWGRIVLAVFIMWDIFTTLAMLEAFPYKDNISYWNKVITIAIMLTTFILILVLLILAISGRPLNAILHIPQEQTLKEQPRIPDRSSLDFFEVFEKMISSALAFDNRRLVVIIDNLDRLTTEEAVGVWAIMRSFFDFSSEYASREWRSRLWVVIPYDPQAFSNATEKESGKEILAALQEKTFLISLRVPPLALANWENYMRGLLTKALPDHDQGELDTVVRLYRQYRLASLAVERNESPGLPFRPITPRDIKRFINRLGGLHRQWQHEVPLLMQALYLLYGEKIISDLYQGKSPNLPSDVELMLGDSRWLEYMAVLHYNLSPEEAMHVLLRERIINALREGDSNTLNNVLRSPHTHSVLDWVLKRAAKQWSEKDGGYLGRAAFALKGAITPDKLKNLLEILRKAALDSELTLHSFDPQVAEGLVALVDCAPRSERQRTLETLWRAIIAVRDTTTAEEDISSNWMDGVISFLRGVKEWCTHPLLIRLGLYWQIVDRITEEKDARELVSLFRPDKEPQEVVHLLAAGYDDTAKAHRATRIVKTLVPVYTEWPWTEFVHTVTKYMDTDIPLRREQAAAIFDTLFFLNTHVSDSKATLDDWTKRGVFHYYLASPSNRLPPPREDVKTMRLQAMCLWAILTYYPVGSPPFTSPWNSQAHEGYSKYDKLLSDPSEYSDILQAFAQVCVEMDGVERLLDVATRHPETRKWVQVTLEEIIREHAAKVPSGIVERREADLRNLVGEEMVRTLKEQLIKK